MAPASRTWQSWFANPKPDPNPNPNPINPNPNPNPNPNQHLRQSYAERLQEKVEEKRRSDEEAEGRRQLEERNDQLQAEKERLIYDNERQRRVGTLDDDDRSAIRRGLLAGLPGEGTDASEENAELIELLFNLPSAPPGMPPPSLPPGPPSIASCQRASA